jgi:hypothetical protein
MQSQPSISKNLLWAMQWQRLARKIGRYMTAAHVAAEATAAVTISYLAGCCCFGGCHGVLEEEFVGCGVAITAAACDRHRLQQQQQQQGRTGSWQHAQQQDGVTDFAQPM